MFLIRDEPDIIWCTVCKRRIVWSGTTSNIARHLRAIHDLENPRPTPNDSSSPLSSSLSSSSSRDHELARSRPSISTLESSSVAASTSPSTDDAVFWIAVRLMQPFSMLDDSVVRCMLQRLHATRSVVPTSSALDGQLARKYLDCRERMARILFDEGACVALSIKPITVANSSVVLVCFNASLITRRWSALDLCLSVQWFESLGAMESELPAALDLLISDWCIAERITSIVCPVQYLSLVLGSNHARRQAPQPAEPIASPMEQSTTATSSSSSSSSSASRTSRSSSIGNTASPWSSMEAAEPPTLVHHLHSSVVYFACVESVLQQSIVMWMKQEAATQLLRQCWNLASNDSMATKIQCDSHAPSRTQRDRHCQFEFGAELSMLRRLLDSRATIDELHRQEQLPQDLVLNTEQWVDLEQLALVLESLLTALGDLSKPGRSLGAALLNLSLVLDTIAKALEHPRFHVLSSLQALLKDRWFDPLSRELGLTLLLDPWLSVRYRQGALPASQMQSLCQYLKQQPPPPPPPPPPPSVDDGTSSDSSQQDAAHQRLVDDAELQHPAKRFKAFEHADPVREYDELERYFLATSVTAPSENPCSWWASHQNTFPTLGAFARKYLAMLPVASTVGVASDAPMLAATVSALCASSLTTEQVRQFIFLSKNSVLYADGDAGGGVRASGRMPQ